MLRQAIAASFDLFWKVEEEPRLDILEYRMNNDPLAISSLDEIDSYISLAEDVPYIYADGPIDSEAQDNTTRTGMDIFIRECDIPVKPHSKLIFRIDGRIYRLDDKDPNEIYGLFEFKLGRAD